MLNHHQLLVEPQHQKQRKV